MQIYADFFQKSLSDPETFWTEQAKRIDWEVPRNRFAITAILLLRAGLLVAPPIFATTQWTAMPPNGLTMRR